MRFFAKDSPTAEAALVEFHKAFTAEHPHPAVNLRAADRLCDAGRLFHGELALGTRVMSARFRCVRSTADLQPDLDYGTFDFIVDGFPAVRSTFESSVVHLTVETGRGVANGSAFFIRPELLLTARHCVDDAANAGSVTLHWHGSEVKPIKLIFPTSDADVAAMLLPTPVDVRPTRVREPSLLEPVLTLGFPVLQGLHPSLMASAGELAGVGTAYLDGNDYWITTCAMTGGSSGGPVIGEDGCVVGVVSGLPATDDGVDPGRFGLMSPCVAVLREIAQNFAQGIARD